MGLGPRVSAQKAAERRGHHEPHVETLPVAVPTGARAHTGVRAEKVEQEPDHDDEREDGVEAGKLDEIRDVSSAGGGHGGLGIETSGEELGAAHRHRSDGDHEEEEEAEVGRSLPRTGVVTDQQGNLAWQDELQ